MFTNAERRLWPGQFVNVALTLTTEAGAVVIPSEAVQVGQEGQHVFVVKEGNRVEMRPVTIQRTDLGEAIIAKGLAPGEQVVREGQFLLGPGSRVEIKDPTKRNQEAQAEGRRGRRGPNKANPDGAGKSKDESRGDS